MKQNGMPEDFEGGLAEMISDGGEYDALRPLGQRRTTEIKLKPGEGEDEASLAMKFGYSAPIMQISKLSQKLYGFFRDAKILGHLEQSAAKGTNSLNDMILDAACVNREGRYQKEEEQAREWQKIMSDSPAADDDIDEGAGEKKKRTDLNYPALMEKHLLDWSNADAFILQARIVEEQRGIDEAAKHNDHYLEMIQQRDDAQMAAAELPAPQNMFFWCRVRQYVIMRERAYDLAMGYPTHDYTAVKTAIAEGHDIHDLVPAMPWPFRESYQMYTGSMMDGEAHREMIMAMIAGQLPARMPPPWAMAGMWPGMPPNGQPEQEGEEGEGQDKRKAVFNFFAKRPQNPEPPQTVRRNGRGRKR